MREGYMPVSDVFEEMDFLWFEQYTSGNRMHRGVTPSLIEETAIFVQDVEKVKVSL